MDNKKDTGADDAVFFVKSSTSATDLGAAVAHAIYARKNITLRAIGAGAINQAVKSVPIAQGYAGSRGHRLAMRPAFFTATVPEGEVSGLSFIVFDEAA
jgi:stage V sporulation protein S